MIKGALILFVEQFLKKGLMFFSTILLAKYLEPKDFGLISIAVFIIALTNSFVESGIKDAIIRKNNSTDITLSTAYWINTGLAIIIYFKIIIITPFLSVIYEEKLLEKILPIIGLTTLFYSQQIVPLAIIHKQMDFAKIVKATFPASIISIIVSIIVAILGYGVWALVIQLILSTLITTYLLANGSQFKPSLKFDKGEAKKLIKFGTPLFFANIVSLTSKNLLFMISSKLLGMSIGGFLFIADKIMETIMGQIIYSIQQASYPALSKYRNNIQELKSHYRDILYITTSITSPILCLLFLTATNITEIFFEDKWSGLEYYIMTLSVAYCLYPIHSMNMNILKIMGETKKYLYLDIIKLTINGLIIFITAYISIKALLVGIILVSFINVYPNCYYTKKIIGYGYIEQLKDYFKTSSVPIILAALIYQVEINWLKPGINALLVSVLLYVIAIFSFYYLFEDKTMREIRNKIKNDFKK